MPGIGQSYNENGSSYSDRLATQWERQTGRKADANDPSYAAWIPEALQAMIAQDRADLQRSQSHWRVADRIATVAALTGIGAGVGAAFSGAGGAGGAAQSASVPGAVGASAPPLGMGSVTAGAVGLPSGVGTAAGTGLGGGLGGGLGTGAAAGRTFLGMSPKDLAAIGLGLGGTIGGALSSKPDLSPNTTTNDPQLQRLLQTMQGRLDKSEPLYDSIMSMSNGLLPTQYQKKGGGGMG